MINYTTPSISLIVEGVDLTQNQDVYVSIEQGQFELEKKGADLILTKEENDTMIVVMLSQEESASFNYNSSAAIQVNWIDEDGIRDATEIRRIDVLKNLLDRVIAYGD